MAKITVVRSVSTVTVTSGKLTRQTICANPSAATALATRLTDDRRFAALWLHYQPPVQLVLPLDAPPQPVQLDLEDAIAAAPPRP